MAVFKPFKAIRPLTEYADKIAALPYDVMSSSEAREMVKDNPYSFLHIDRAEIDLDVSVDPYSPEVYQKAKSNLEGLVTNHLCEEDADPCYYIYRQTMNGRTQNGIVGCASIDDYKNNIIKKHEKTRAEKEVDRCNHVNICNAHTGPIFLTYKKQDKINEIIAKWQAENEPVYSFNQGDGVDHTVWVVDDEEINEELCEYFNAVESFYIADGHHRCASAVKVGFARREENPDYTGEEEFNFFLAVLFPDDELAIMDYNRVIADTNGNTVEELIEKISKDFTVEEYKGEGQYHPENRHNFGMYIENKWYKLTAKEGTFDENNAIDSLDVSILQNNLIAPILGIEDPRVDHRIDFVGGIRGLKELEKRANSDMKLAFSMYPTSIKELMDIADAGEIMPPKSTWFEPKLLSGLFIHKI